MAAIEPESDEAIVRNNVIYIPNPQNLNAKKSGDKYVCYRIKNMSGLQIGDNLYKLEPVGISDNNVEILEPPFADGNPDHFPQIKPVNFSGSIGQAMSPLTKLNATMNQFIVSGFRAKVHDRSSGVIRFFSNHTMIHLCPPLKPYF
jgi:hypothetical protein